MTVTREKTWRHAPSQRAGYIQFVLMFVVLLVAQVQAAPPRRLEQTTQLPAGTGCAPHALHKPAETVVDALSVRRYGRLVELRGEGLGSFDWSIDPGDDYRTEMEVLRILATLKQYTGATEGMRLLRTRYTQGPRGTARISTQQAILGFPVGRIDIHLEGTRVVSLRALLIDENQPNADPANWIGSEQAVTLAQQALLRETGVEADGQAWPEPNYYLSVTEPDYALAPQYQYRVEGWNIGVNALTGETSVWSRHFN